MSRFSTTLQCRLSTQKGAKMAVISSSMDRCTQRLSAKPQFLLCENVRICFKVKFWGKSIEFQPKGLLTVEFPLTGEMFTWNNVNCIVHNIVGQYFIENRTRLFIYNFAAVFCRLIPIMGPPLITSYV